MSDVDEALARVAELVRGATMVTLVCHHMPDGDALGSLLAFHLLCQRNGVRSVASWPEPFEVAEHYRFLPGLELATKPADVPQIPELMITFDCGSLSRLGELAATAQRAGELVVLDHHASNEGYGTVNVVDPDAASTATVVRALARELGWPLDRDIAMCLYTGLVTDTGRFQYQNTTPEVFALAEELSQFGLPISNMSRQLFEKHRFAYLQMVGAVLARAEYDPELRFVVSWTTNFDYDGFDVEVDEAEGLIDLLRRTAEAEVSCVCKEAPEGIRVSLRSVSDDIDVAALARRFGGGGHHHAAGFTAAYPVADVVESIRSALRDLRRPA